MVLAMIDLSIKFHMLQETRKRGGGEREIANCNRDDVIERINGKSRMCSVITELWLQLRHT